MDKNQRISNKESIFRNALIRRSRRFLRHVALIGLVLTFAPLEGNVASGKAGGQTGQNFNYGEALQKAVFFYEEQVSGAKPSTNRVTWRADAALNDGSDVGKDLTGGWFDAGDHIKFGFAMASAATMLAWGAVEYRQAFVDSGQLPFLLNNLRVANDYFIKAHTAPNELYGQIGTQSLDHSFWGPPEIMQMQRPAAKIDAAHPGSDLAAETAAAMAAASIVFRPTDPTYADTLLTHSKQLFAFAQATAGTFYVDVITDAQCCYNSRFGGPNDELAWAAIWLFKATGDNTFLTDARQIYPTMCTDPSGVPCFNWTQNWNDKEFGVYVLMAKATGEAQFKTDTQRWLDFWSIGAGARTPGGLMFVNGFGSLRYATNTAFIAFVYADFLGTTDPLYSRYHDFAKKQIDYVLGANPANHSFMGGFGNNPPINEHHRAGHGSWANGGPSGPPTNNRHVLYGGMVGGPTSADDFAWADDRTNFQENEVACDYNAGLVGGLARLFQEFGGTPLANFPPIETPDGDEIFISAGINASGTNFTEIKALVTNMSAWPARMLDHGTFRYFFTLEPGVTPSQITLNQNFTQCSGGLTGPVQWSGNIYYVEINCIGTQIYPGGQSVFQREVQFRMTSSGAWDPTNDYSFQGLAGVTGGQTVKTHNIVLYSNGVKIWGTEPGAATPGPSVSLTSPANGATFIAPAAITLNAAASDNTAAITKVDFFNGATLLGTDTTAPYSFTLPSAAAGSYSFTAKATDTTGATATSSAVSVTVNPPADVPPTVSITSPANGATFTAPANITINATAADSDGTVTKVDFFNGSTLLGTATTAPYTFTLSNAAAGTYNLTARATDNAGLATTSAALTVTVNTPGDVPPTVSITAPASGATFTAPANVTVTAAASDSDGTVTKVDFFNGSTLVGTVTTAPYTLSLANLAAGMYTLTAKATDNGGASTTSAPVTIAVNGVMGTCSIVYKNVNQWPGGFQGEIDITNNGAPINAWTLSWSFPSTQTITQLWNGAVTQTGANVTVTNLSYNGSIATGGTTTFGFLASWNNVSNPSPTTFVLNGATCQ